MRRNNPNRIEAMEAFLLKIPNLAYGRALEVGCGRGHLTMDLLQNVYKYIDMFDRSKSACKFARRKFDGNLSVSSIT